MTKADFLRVGAMQHFAAVAIALLLMSGAARAQATLPGNQAVEASLDASGKRAVEGLNAFAVDLYKRSISPEQNLLISPACVSTAVGLAYRGAKGATADELRSVMHFDAPPEAYLRADAEVLKTLNFSGARRQLRVTNAIWAQQDLPFNPDFLTDMTSYAKAGLQRVDFLRSRSRASRH